MVSLIMEFATALKQEGIMVPPVSLHNALQAMEWIDPLNQQEFKSALQGCLIGNEIDIPVFESCFKSYFIDKNPLVLKHENSAFKIHVKEFADQLREGAVANHILADYIEGDANALINKLNINALDPEGQHIPVSGGEEPKKLNHARELEKMRSRVSILIELAEDFSARSFNLSREKRTKMNDYLRAKLEEAASLMDKKPKVRNRKHIMPWERKRTLSSISFNQLTQREIERVKEEVDKMAVKLNDALSQQRKRAHKGHIDIKKTIRESMKFGGIPFDIKMKQPAKKKGKVVAICDISSSVSYAAQFMILLLYRLQNRFSKIRTFVFIRDTHEITSFFEKNPLELAMLKAIKEHNIGMGQPSNYGKSFQSFFKKYETVLSKDTTLLILGDGQNNFNEPLVADFEKMTKKVERTIWLNPEQEKFWNSNSNSMRHYKPYCTQVKECATLDQLGEFIRELVL